MFHVYGPCNTVVWDAETDKVLIQFKGGRAITNDSVLAERMKALGYSVDGGQDADPEKTKGARRKRED